MIAEKAVRLLAGVFQDGGFVQGDSAFALLIVGF